jgi:putative transcription factor
MNHQDWKPIVIYGKVLTDIKQNFRRPHHEVTKTQKLDQTELGTHEKVSLSIAKTIQQARIAKGFKTQKDLAIAVGVPASVINSYEGGKAIPDVQIMQKLRRVLGVKLKV